MRSKGLFGCEAPRILHPSGAGAKHFGTLKSGAGAIRMHGSRIASKVFASGCNTCLRTRIEKL